VNKSIFAAASFIFTAAAAGLAAGPIPYVGVFLGVAQAATAPLPAGHPKIGEQGSGKGTAPTIDFSKIAKPKGGKTVQEVYKEKASLNGKPVTLRAKVVKYNGEILGKNWLHLRDGTGSEAANDLTVTTQAKAKVGDTVLVEGIVRLDKDFGSGYRYDLIIEDAKVKVE